MAHKAQRKQDQDKRIPAPIPVTPAEGKTERVGSYDFTVRRGEPSPESEKQWAQRADALAAWLMSEWEREHAKPK
jgi:hypothetical protein